MGLIWRIVEGFMKEEERWVSLELGLEVKKGIDGEGEGGEEYGYVSFVEVEAAAVEIPMEDFASENKKKRGRRY